jgi:hypothetical protein
MMKKLLALMLVFAVSSVASAALTLDVALTVMAPGETQAIGISGAEPLTPPPLVVYLMVEGPASIDGGTMLYQGGGLESYDDAEAIAAGIGISVDELIVQFRDFVGMPDLLGTLVSDIVLTYGGPGDADLTLLGEDFTTVYDAVTIIPEPVTIALLGLGGLFLRRRR